MMSSYPAPDSPRPYTLAVLLALATLSLVEPSPANNLPLSVALPAATDPAALVVPRCGDGPQLLAVPLLETWPQHQWAKNRAIAVFTDTPNDRFADQRVVASQDQVGTTFGIAYDPYRNHLYASAYYKRDTQFGPGGPGAIYRVDLATGNVTLWARLDAGPDHHRGEEKVAARWVGKSSLGDIDISDDASTLFVTNLHDRMIHRLSLPDGHHLGAFPHAAAAQPWAPNARPFGLASHDGWLYHAVVDSREDPDLPGRLSGHVYRTGQDGSEPLEVAAFDMDYPRRPTWGAWDDARPPDSTPGTEGYRGQPIIADLAFRPNGDLIIGLRDRVADMVITIYSTDIQGDLLHTAPAAGGWRVLTSPEWYDDKTLGDEATLGTLAAVPQQDLVVTTASSPDRDPHHPIGVLWFDNTTGRVASLEPLLQYLYQAQDWVLGLGDLEFICRRTVVPTPTASPLASHTPPTPPPTNTPTLPPTVPPSPSPTTAPTSELLPVFLPIALAEACPVERANADVVLVVDVSTSMLRPTTANRPKLAAVKHAATTFLGLVNFSPTSDGRHDQVAIVAFNATAWIEHPISAKPRLLQSAVDRLSHRVAQGTRLDLAILRGVEALQDPARKPENTAVLILMTDGMPNRVPTPDPEGSQEDTVLAAARHAQGLGLRIYTIGVGRPDAPDIVDRINPQLLRAVASDPSMYYQTPDAEDLSRIYSEIAVSIACPPTGLWGRR